MYKNLANTLFVGKNLIFLTSCHSTNQEAYDILGKSTVPDGTIVITEDQTAGRGQMGNTWESERGKNLTFSLILRPKFLKASQQFMLNMSVSLGITDWLLRFRPEFTIKWPNDIYFLDRKVSGILIQNQLKKQGMDTSIVGIGLNINQQEFSIPQATSLTAITGETFGLQNCLEELAGYLEQRYLQLRGGGSGLHEDYMSRLYRFNEEHLFESEGYFRGRIIAVKPDGTILIKTAGGLRSFQFKEVAYVI